MCVMPHLTCQPTLGQSPVPKNGLGRHLQKRARFLHAQAGKESQLHNLRLPGIERLQRVQGRVELQERVIAIPSRRREFIQRYAHGSAAPFGGAAGDGVVDQYTAHDIRGQGKEMRSILPIDRLAVHQPQKSFVNQRRWLERVILALPRHVAAGDDPQFAVDDWRQMAQGI